MAPLSTKSADAATPFIEMGDCSISMPFAFRRPINSLCTKFATRFGLLAALAAASNWSVRVVVSLAVGAAGSGVASLPAALERRGLGGSGEESGVAGDA